MTIVEEKETALNKLQRKLDAYLDEMLTEEYAKQKGELKRIDTLKVPRSVFIQYLRCNLLSNVEDTVEEKKRKWETFSSSLRTSKGEVPIVVVYDGFAIYTDTISLMQDLEKGSKVIYYTKSKISTVPV